MKNFFRPQFCLSPDLAAGDSTGDEPTPPAAGDSASAPSPAGEPPPAATVVVNGEITEEMARLRKKNEELESRATKAEKDAAYALDEARRLKEAGLKAPPAAPAVVDKRSALERFMETGETD